MYVDYAEVGNRISKRRKELGFKQRVISEKVDISDKYMSNIERGKAIMSVDTLMKICAALETTPDYLLLGAVENITAENYEKAVTKGLNKLNAKKLKLVLNFIDWLDSQEMK